MSQRNATKVLEGVGQKLWGFRPNLMADVVDQRGGVAAVRWFAQNMPGYERIRRKLGPIPTHLVSTLISTVNGCAYCTRGHAYAFQLHYLDEHDALFLLDDDEIVKLHGEPNDVIVTRLNAALAAAGLDEHASLVVRTVELMEDSSLRNGGDDDAIMHLIEMFAVLNQCGIKGDTPPDEAHDPINRNEALRARYAELRAA